MTAIEDNEQLTARGHRTDQGAMQPPALNHAIALKVDGDNGIGKA